MIVLGIDTSTTTGGAALVDKSGLVAEYTLNIYDGHSERILPTISGLLKDTGISLDKIQVFAVVSGPGSFTGLRVGLATIKGFAYALGKPVVPVTALQALAWQNQHYPYILCPVMDARRREVFTQIYRGGVPISQPMNIKIEGLVAKLADYTEPVLFVGQGVAVYQDVLAQVGQAVFPSSVNLGLRPASVAGLGLHLAALQQSEEWHQVMPVYMRKSSAEYQLRPMGINHEKHDV